MRAGMRKELVDGVVHELRIEERARSGGHELAVVLARCVHRIALALGRHDGRRELVIAHVECSAFGYQRALGAAKFFACNS